MKKNIPKIVSICASVVSAWILIYILVLLFRKSGIEVLRQATFWISPLSITGWILFGFLCIAFYVVYMKLFYIRRVQ